MLPHVKEYLRVSGDHDDNMLGLLIDSAKEYLSNAGVPDDVEEDKLYKLAITMLVTHWYENREQDIDGRTSRTIELGLQTIILQLKAGADYEPRKV